MKNKCSCNVQGVLEFLSLALLLPFSLIFNHDEVVSFKIYLLFSSTFGPVSGRRHHVFAALLPAGRFNLSPNGGALHNGRVLRGTLAAAAVRYAENLAYFKR